MIVDYLLGGVTLALLYMFILILFVRTYGLRRPGQPSTKIWRRTRPR